jgi:hypothetical protein
VDGQRIAGITTILEGTSPGARRESENWDNPSPGISMPCLIYGFPRDWRPASISLAIAFRRKPYPDHAWAVVAPTFFDLACANERHDLPLQEDMVMARIDKPRRDRLYGIFWTWGAG